MLKQFAIHWVDLDPTRGAETQKNRPCVIIQSNMVNQHTRTIIVAPLLPGHKHWPFAVNITPSHDNALDKERHINLKQLRAVDVSRLQQKLGHIEANYKPEIDKALSIIFGSV